MKHCLACLIYYFKNSSNLMPYIIFSRVPNKLSPATSQVRKDLQPVLRKARREQNTAFFNVEKLSINGAIIVVLNQTNSNLSSPHGDVVIL